MKRVLFFLGALVWIAIAYSQAHQPMSYLAMISTTDSELLTSRTKKSEPTKHYIGEYFGGGIIFYLDEEGKHGLITATIDKSTRKRNRGETYIHTNEVRDGITTGTFNANRLNAMKGTGENDAQVAENYQETKLSDWYLPTRYDLIKLYRNRSVIGGYSEFAKGWKSTEVSSVNEWYQSFVTGGEFSNGKDDATYIRVIRKF
jgi:hypothetical protein